VHVVGNDFEFVRAIAKPNADTKITQEFWFKGKAKHFQKKEGDEK
jgi:hypothetical protein